MDAPNRQFPGKPHFGWSADILVRWHRVRAPGLPASGLAEDVGRVPSPGAALQAKRKTTAHAPGKLDPDASQPILTR